MAGLGIKVKASFDELLKLKKEIQETKDKMRELAKTGDDKAYSEQKKHLTDLYNAHDNLQKKITVTVIEVKKAEDAMKASIKTEEDIKRKIEGRTKALGDLNEKIIDQKAVIKDVQADVERLAQTYKGLGKADPGKSSALSELTAAKNALKEEKAALSGLQTEHSKTKNSLSSLKDEYTKQTKITRDAAKANQELVRSLESIPGPVGSAVSGIKNMTTAALAFLATPLGWAIAAVVGGLMALTSWFNRTEEGQNALNVASAGFKAVMDSILDVIDDVGEGIYKVFTKPKEAVKDLGEYIQNQVVNRLKALQNLSPGNLFSKGLKGDYKGIGNDFLQLLTGVDNAGGKLGNYVEDVNSKIQKRVELAERENRLIAEERAFILERARLEQKIAESREIAYDNSKSKSDQKAALNEASKAIDELYNKEIHFAKERKEIIAEQNALSHSNRDAKEKEVEAEAELFKLEARRSTAQRTLLERSNRLNRASDPAAVGSIAFLNKMISDAKANFEKATTDESRIMYSKLISDLETQLNTIQERIALAGADVVTEAIQGAIKGVKVVSGTYDTAVKIGGNTVDTSGLKRLVEKNAPSLMDSLFKSADKMAVSSIIKLLNQAKEASKQAFNPADAKAYQDAIEKLETELRQRSPFKAISEDWGSLMTSIKNGDKDGIAAAATGLSQGIGNVQGQLEQIAGGIGEIFGEEAGYAAQQVTELTGAIAGFASGASKLASGDILGGITDVVSSVGKIFSMSRRTKEMNEAARKEVQDYYDTAIKGEREYQALLRQRAREAAEADRKTLESFKNTMDELSKQSNSIQAEYDKVWSALMGEEYVSGRGYKHGTWLRKAKTWDIMSSLNGLSYDDIEKLYTEGKLKDNAKELFEQLRDLKEEGLDVNEMLKDQAEALNEYASGMTFDSLRDSIKDAFSDGRMDIQESANFTRDVFRKSMMQALEAKVLNKSLEPFLDSFTKDATEGTLFAKMDYYENWIRQIGEEGNKFMESLTSLPGLSDIFSSSSSDNTLKGAFAKASQESIDLLAGQMGAGRIAWDKTAVNTDSIRESINAALELSRQKLEEVKAIRVLTEKIEQSNAAIQATNEKVAENTDGINSIAQSLKDISTHGLDLK